MSEVNIVVGNRVLRGVSGGNLGEILAKNGVIALPCGGRGLCGLCRVVVKKGSTSPPSKYERALGYTGPVRLACQTRVLSDVEVELFPGLAKPVRINTVVVNPRRVEPVVTKVKPRLFRVLDRVVELTTDLQRALLVDLGTTKTAYQVVDLEGDVLAEDSVFTPLQDYGADIITRLTKALEDKRYMDDMTTRLRGLVSEIADKHNAGLVLLAGNSVMESIFFGLKLDSLAEYPYQPPTRGPILDSLGGRLVLGFPMLHGYLGGDAYADLVATLELRLETPYLLIDIGTNTEIFLVKEEVVYGTSTPSGPAFETGVSRGSTIVQGGVYEARIDRLENGRPVFSYKYLVSTSGILGPALVSIVADLRRHGLVDENGKFTTGYATIEGGLKVFYIDPSKDLYVSQLDVRNLQKAVAAVKSGIRILMREAGVSSSDLRQVVVAGSFGAALDLEDAMAIGLVPQVDRERVLVVGNLVLPGLRVAFLDREYLVDFREIAGKMLFVELPKVADYMNVWIDSLRLSPL
ncbi:ASKHA domain-containing protein [Thermogladius sp. KZ2Tp1]|uniref:ASKHA domain-containing protein n=1 Tax=Thermogladius sp. KZ2Tp1 TaxID=3136289 RepID=UPI003DA951EF